jgi:hemerythrin superfamily protein
MDIDSSAYQRGEFPVDQPMEALKTEHNMVRELFDRYFEARDANDKRDIGRHVLLLLEMHTSLEESAFYPRVREADSSLVEHCEQEHEHAKQLIERLKLMEEGDPQAEQTYRQLADAVLQHIETEEQKLFPKIQQANIDMISIGQEMQALETTLIARYMQKPIAPGLRQ